MKNSFLILIICICNLSASAQLLNFNDVNPDTTFENILSREIYSDSLSTSFIIWIKQEVLLHKHAEHTEQVYILEGTANMLLGDKWIAVKAGDYIVIPKGTPHQVKVSSAVPLKVLSIQSPMFDGTDRILLKN